MKKIIIWIIAAVAIAVGVFYVYQKFFSPSQGVSEIARISSSKGTRAGNLGTVKAKRGNIVITISSFGHVRANREESLRFRTGGIVEKINVKQGEKVKKGQVLAALKSPSQQFQLLQAKNNYEKAKLEGIKSEIEEKKLSYESAYENYEKTLIKAPFDGEVTDIAVYEGDSVGSSTSIISLINRDKMYVDIDVDEVDIRKVAIGQEALVKFDAYPELTLPAQVSEISPIATAKGAITVIKVSLELNELDERIKPNFSTEAEIIVGKAENVLIIPEAEIIVGKAENVLIIPIEAVVERLGENFVTAVVEGQQRPIPIKLGIGSKEYVEVVSGLSEGQEIVANNYQLNEQFQKMAEEQKGKIGEKNMGAFREMQMMEKMQSIQKKPQARPGAKK